MRREYAEGAAGYGGVLRSRRQGRALEMNTGRLLGDVTADARIRQQRCAQGLLGCLPYHITMDRQRCPESAVGMEILTIPSVTVTRAC